MTAVREGARAPPTATFAFRGPSSARNGKRGEEEGGGKKEKKKWKNKKKEKITKMKKKN